MLLCALTILIHFIDLQIRTFLSTFEKSFRRLLFFKMKCVNDNFDWRLASNLAFEYSIELDYIYLLSRKNSDNYSIFAFLFLFVNKKYHIFVI